jgi:hypothetical protein
MNDSQHNNTRKMILDTEWHFFRLSPFWIVMLIGIILSVIILGVFMPIGVVLSNIIFRVVYAVCHIIFKSFYKVHIWTKRRQYWQGKRSKLILLKKYVEIGMVV